MVKYIVHVRSQGKQAVTMVTTERQGTTNSSASAWFNCVGLEPGLGERKQKTCQVRVMLGSYSLCLGQVRPLTS